MTKTDGALGGPTLVGLSLFRPCAQVSTGPQHLLIGLSILHKQFHRSREPVLIFPEHVGGRLGIANMFGRFKRRLRALLTPGKPTVRKFLQGLERGFLVLPELDAYRSIGLQCSRWLQDVRKLCHVIAHDFLRLRCQPGASDSRPRSDPMFNIAQSAQSLSRQNYCPGSATATAFLFLLWNHIFDSHPPRD